jgi:hypothetical protein
MHARGLLVLRRAKPILAFVRREKYTAKGYSHTLDRFTFMGCPGVKPGPKEQVGNTLLRHIGRNNIEAYLLKARIVEPEKQPLLANGSETSFVSRQ